MGQNSSQDVRTTDDQRRRSTGKNDHDERQSILTLTKEEEIELYEQFNTFQEQLRQKDLQGIELQSKLRTKEQEVMTIKELLTAKQKRVNELQIQLEKKEHELNRRRMSEEEERQQVMELQNQLRTNEPKIITTREKERQVGLLLEAEQCRVRELQRQLKTKEEEMTATKEQLEGRLREMQSQLETSGQEMTGMREQLRETQQELKNSRDWVMYRNEIQITDQVLGEGAWGKIYRGKVHGCVVAVKEMHENILCDNNRRLFVREVDIASKCRHPCLLQFIGATIDNERPLLVTEIMDCSLRARLQNDPPLSVTEVCDISLDVARALNYLHQKRPEPIVHNDVSSANVLLWRHGDQWRAKVADYGTANFVRRINVNYAGAVIYCAPESLNNDPGQPISCKVDVYSFGVLLCEICTREQPDPERRQWQMAGLRNSKFENLARRCINNNPWVRPNMESVVEELETLEIEETSAESGPTKVCNGVTQ